VSKEIIKLSGLGRAYDGGEKPFYALSNLELTVNEGEYIAISGPSGSGKSTLLSILGLLDKPTEGQYLLTGTDTHNLSSAQLAELRNYHIGFVFQSFNLIDEMSVLENVMLPLTFREPVLERSKIEAQALSCLEKVQLADKYHNKPNELSGGQQQRVAIARALVTEPSIILVDEPTGNLDSVNGDMVMDYFDKLHGEGKTICLVTHEMEYARRATRIIQLKDGELVSELRAEIGAA